MRKKRSLEVYLEELNRIAPLPEDLELILFDKAADGDAESRKVLIERYLPWACDLAGEFDRKEQKLDPEDLIQEANMGLVLAVGKLEKETSLAAYRAKLMNAVTENLESYLQEEAQRSVSDRKIVTRMNQLAQVAEELEEMLDHRPSVDEISAYLDLPAEQIRNLLKMSGNSLPVDT